MLNRRECLFVGGLAGLSAFTTATRTEAATASAQKVRFCLNTSSIRGQKLSLAEEIEIAGEVGYDGIEPWIREIEAHKESGKKLAELKKRLDDHGLQVESAIGFARWIVDDETERAKGVEQLKRDMELVAALGGTRIAAPPVGAHQQSADKLDLFAAADRYHAILEVGRECGVTPQVEIWGPSKNLSRLGEAVFVAVESGHPDACILPDIYHIYRGGSAFDGLGVLSGSAIKCFHFNDYPASPARPELNDSDRVYPGDGAAPWKMVIDTLKAIGFQGACSLELFNKGYWEQDAREVAKTGLEKMKAVWEA